MAPLEDPLPAELPGWFLVGVPLLGIALVFVIGLGVAGIWQLLDRLRRLGALSARFDAVDGIAKTLKTMVDERADLDLRRIEHVLIEIRDAQARLDQTLQRVLERPPPAPGEFRPEARGLGERVTNRLVALGYERVQILTPIAELDELATEDGDVLVEARRFGSLCKGRVQIKGGLLGEVRLQPGYSTFP